MKKIILLATALILSASMYAQSFNVQITDNFDGKELRSSNAILETDDGSLMMSLTMEEERYGRIVKLSDKGEFVEADYIEIKEGAHRGYHPFFRHPKQENCNVYVYFTHGEPTAFNALFIDNDLNVTKRIRTDLPYSDKDERLIVYTKTESCLLDSDNNIVVLKRVGDTQNFILVKIDLDGTILLEKEISVNIDLKDWKTLYNAFVVYNKEPLQYAFMFIRNSEFNPELCMVVLDSEFNVIETIDNFNDPTLLSTNTPSLSEYDDDHYLRATAYLNNGAPLSFSINLAKIDKNHNVVKECRYETTTESNPGHKKPYISYKSIVTTKDGMIYWIYSKPRTNGIQDLYVSYLDGDLNLMWERLVHENVNLKHWNLMSATTRSNGNLLISAWTFDNPNIIMTIVMDNTGQTMNVTEHYAGARPYSFYPNPADNEICLSMSPDVNCEKVEIFSIDGKLCLEQNFNFNSIDVKSLSDGIYMMKVTLSNGNSYTDKIVVR